MLNPNERWIFFHRMIIGSSPEHAPAIPLKDLVPLLTQMVRDSEAYKLIESDTACIRISDIECNEELKIVKMLFQYANENATDPVFSVLKTGQLRTEPKLDGEGIAVSAHAVVKIEPLQENGDEYLFLLEEVPGLGRSTVDPFLKTLFKAVSKERYHFQDEENNGRLKQYRPVPKLYATPSKKFSDELEGAHVDEIELVRRTRRGDDDFDELDYYEESSRNIKLTVVNQMGESPGALERLKRKARAHGYDDIKIRYRHAGGKRRTAIMGTADVDLQDALIGRVEKIISEKDLEQCAEGMVESFVEKVVGLLDEE